MDLARSDFKFQKLPYVEPNAKSAPFDGPKQLSRWCQQTSNFKLWHLFDTLNLSVVLPIIWNPIKLGGNYRALFPYPYPDVLVARKSLEHFSFMYFELWTWVCRVCPPGRPVLSMPCRARWLEHKVCCGWLRLRRPFCNWGLNSLAICCRALLAGGF